MKPSRSWPPEAAMDRLQDHGRRRHSAKAAFQHAFNSGADFVLAGIFDFQMEDDVRIARDALAQIKRTRPWLA